MLISIIIMILIIIMIIIIIIIITIIIVIIIIIIIIVIIITTAILVRTILPLGVGQSELFDVGYGVLRTETEQAPYRYCWRPYTCSPSSHDSARLHDDALSPAIHRPLVLGSKRTLCSGGDALTCAAGPPST